MTKREKFLATVLLAVLALGASLLLFQVVILDPLKNVITQLVDAEEQQITAQGELEQCREALRAKSFFRTF